MNDLKNIGFYTLSNKRAKQTSINSPLYRGELLITSKCNFSCPYCRGTDKSANITFNQAKNVVDIWSKHKIKNIRFSGGEPTLVPWLSNLIEYTNKQKSIQNIAISSNGSAKTDLYIDLIKKGVTDFSISLDACCAEDGDLMSGGVKGSWEKVINNIKLLSQQVYVSVGVVLTEQNIQQTIDIIKYASNELKVADIRIITAAQFNKRFKTLDIPQYILNRHPILNYRIKNIKQDRDMRGIKNTDSHNCPLLIDDIAVKGNKHYPCIIKMREGCMPIGNINDSSMRKDRFNYYKKCNTHTDLICKHNCLDVCIDYNNKVKQLQPQL